VGGGVFSFNRAASVSPNAFSFSRKVFVAGVSIVRRRTSLFPYCMWCGCGVVVIPRRVNSWRTFRSIRFISTALVIKLGMRTLLFSTGMGRGFSCDVLRALVRVYFPKGDG